MENILKIVTILYLLLASNISQADRESLRLSILDIGEGDSILIESQGQSALIDTGNPFSAHRINQFLISRKISRLTALILTHPHFDHIGGAFFISEAFDPDLVIDNAERFGKDLEEQYYWYEKLRKNNPKYKAFKSGDKLKIGAASLEVLWPAAPSASSDWNTNSLVIRVVVGKFNALLMGDANYVSEQALLESGINLKADLLKIGHHGAGDSGSPNFISAVAPKYTIVSVDKNNRFGRPDNDRMQQLAKNSLVLKTSERGHIIFVLDEDGTYRLAK